MSEVKNPKAMSEKIVDVSGYGLYCLSIESFTSFLKNHNIKTKKLNSFFDKNRNILEEAIKDGYLLPIATINSIAYYIEVKHLSEAVELGEEWQEVLTIENCNLRVGTDSAIWIGTLDTLDNWNPADFKEQESISYETLDGETLHSSQKFTITPADYKVKLLGFKRKKILPYPTANFGFVFELRETSSFDSFTNPLVENVNIAKM
ncbi:hypothetical protein [Hymenobacter chitinivorans]|uniref:Uncharacterized protein n=1 Tax=Hymenobacter chitinivorans DSM 11115 TaxID=1121954 RepID=A0A2M9BN23_9BACT|nr:hypothetical protein [Hymenobacter chitinivorans]PJJ59361.1 hypothetical protein CLV45_0778 [Hymenobacter chitinivorans DSM 11115]